MHRLVILVGLLASGCSIERAAPNYVAPTSALDADAPWPRLSPSNSLANSDSTVTTPQAQLAARIARLRARAGALSAAQF
ncbi:hypothetical protein GCM10007939_12560 [Amylibacter marinus]|uniref:Uncharacterized protein n=1 Tax=Amylibacter marinus TaxID=1475483 RepID=A0ABQ5VU54_9RHOB|nr:hypothetical protein [Amylibacter marinus]GLQ34973.1 hypothetical protein GCM10007939_12560 [Amylibacter marinus]